MSHVFRDLWIFTDFVGFPPFFHRFSWVSRISLDFLNKTNSAGFWADLGGFKRIQADSGGSVFGEKKFKRISADFGGFKRNPPGISKDFGGFAQISADFDRF